MVNIGIIGAGRIGRFHANTLVTQIPDANVLAIADVNAGAAQSVAQALHIPNTSGNYRDVIENPDVEAVLIASSTDTHSQFTIEAAQAGKHIFCEKPIDFDLKRIDEVLEIVEQSGVKYQVGFNRRFDPSFQRIKKAIEAGAIGTPHLLHIISRDPGPPPIAYIKVSGGLFFDMAIHDFDMARFLFGEVEEIYATAGVMVDPAIGEAGDIDTALTTLKFTSGAIGTIDNSRKAVYGYDQRVEAFGSAGSARADNLYENTVILSNAEQIQRDLPLHFFIERYTPSFIAELKAFVEAIVNDTPTPVSGIDGKIPVVMAMAAKRSSLENRPVRLSEITA